MYKALLIDDETWVLEDLKTLVDWEELGFEIVAEAKNIDEAREAVLSERPDLIISDIRMPSMNGIDFMESYRNLYHVKTVFVTAYGTFEYARKALELGAFGYLLKPVEEEELIKTLKKAKETLDQEKGWSEKLKYFEQTKFINSLIDGYSNFEELRDDFRTMEIEIKDTPMVIAIIKTSNELNKTMFSFPAMWQFYLLPMSNRKKLLILQYQQEFVSVVAYKNLIKSLNSAADEYNMLIGVSRVVTDLKRIRNGFIQADTACDSEFIFHKKMIVYRDGHKNIKDVKTFINYGKMNKTLMQTLDQLPALLVKKRINIENFMPILQHLAAQMGVQSEVEDLDGKELVNQFKDINGILDYLRASRTDPVKRGGRKNTSKYVIKEITEYIKNNYNQKLMINSLAQKFFLNPSYLSNLFKIETGKSFTSYLVEFRLKKAIELLETTDLSLYEISTMVGYEDYFHFSKLFKKHMNTSPGNYRKERFRM